MTAKVREINIHDVIGLFYPDRIFKSKRIS